METPPEHEDETNPAETDETEMTGSTDPGTVATPEGTTEVDEELEDRGDV
jgi:hypothetical protein